MKNTPITHQLADGRILRDTDGVFTEYIDGKWVAPKSDFLLDDFLNGNSVEVD